MKGMMKTCSVNDCDNKQLTKKLCSKHYQRFKRHGSTEKLVSRPLLTHGMYYTRIYRIYRSMISRCTYDNQSGYEYYKGRGITVCDEWSTFEAFLEDMKDTYSDDLTLDRIDNSLGYSKENCRWATPGEQSRNRRSNVWVEYNGEKIILKDLAKKIDMNYVTLRDRIRRYNYSLDDAINKPIRNKRYKDATV